MTSLSRSAAIAANTPGVSTDLAAQLTAGGGLMIDVTGASLDRLLAALGVNLPDVIATYVTGSAGVDATSGQLARLHRLNTGVFLYDQSPQLALFASGAADGADIERGAGTTGAFIDAARKREARGWYSWAYISESGLAGLRGEVTAAGLKRVQYGAANWNDSLAKAQAELGADVVFVQWASPSSNPGTIVPGTGGTLSQLNCDLNVTVPGWFAHPAPAPAPVPPVHKHGLLVQVPATPGADLTGQLVTSADGRTWTIA